MNRRALLATAGSSLTACSGCLLFTDERNDLPTEEQPRTETPVEDGTPTATVRPADVTVESAIQQRGYVSPDSPDSIGVTDVGTRYLVADVSVAPGPLERDDFTLTVGSAGRKPTTPDRFYRTSWGDDVWYEQGRERGLLAFEVPDDPGSGPPRLRWPSGSWQAPKDLVRRRTTPAPTLTAALTVPNADDGSTDETVEVEVTNESDAAGRYLGALNRAGPAVASTPVARVSGLVPGGETRTLEIEDSWSQYPSAEDRGDGETDVIYRLDDAGSGDSLEVALGESS